MRDGRHDQFYRYTGAEIGRYYATCVVGGPGAFVMPVTDPSQFAAAMRQKLVREIAARPARVVPVGFMVRTDGGRDCSVGE